jgi:hypothetical protein
MGSYCAAAYELKSFLERCPDQALLVRQLALSQMTVGHHSAPRAAMIVLGDTAVRASLVTPLDKDPEAAAIREMLLATSQLKEQRLFDALDHLNRCRSYVSQIESTPLGRWATAKEALLRGDLSVESFELSAAEKNYGEAYEHAASLLADVSAIDEFCRTWVELIVPPGHPEGPKTDLAAEPRWELKHIALRSLQEAAAITRDTGRADPIRKVGDAFARIGRVQLVRPMLLVQALSSAPAEERVAFCALLREMADSRLAAFFAARGGQAPPELLEQMSGLTESDEAEKTEIDVVERLAEIESHLIAGDLSQAVAAWNKNIEEIAAARMSFPLLYAVGQQLRFAAENREDQSPAFQQFLQILGAVAFEISELLFDPQYRSMIDPSIELATTYAIDSLSKDPKDTTALSSLLALQRSPRVSGFPRLLGFPEHEGTTAEEGIATLADTLKRIQLGLPRWGDAVVLITQKRPAGLAFICCESTNVTPRVINADHPFMEAMDDLDQAATKAEGSQAAWIHTVLEEKGRDAFSALPDDVRDAILRHNTLLLVPDYSAGHDGLSFELMHNGDGYLLGERVIARFTSLQQLAETFDKRTRTPRKRRAMVIGIDNAKDFEPLPLAETERKDVSSALSERGFDVPLIAADRVTSRFITDRLSFVDVFHVAGHGETAVGIERLILSDGSWLDSTDLERWPQSSLPFVYLNTCELGEARFLGGGRGRGLAFTFAELGAPAVLAYTKSVFDDVSAALAKTFYRESLQCPVGEALRRTRKKLLKTYPAPEVARLVLLGNPKHVLPGVQGSYQVDDPTDDLLDKYFDLGASRDDRSEVLTYLLNHGREHGPRLEAAAYLVFSREEAMHAEEGNDPIRLRDAIALSEAINHRRSAALFKMKVAQLSVKERAADAADRLRAALPDVTALARVDSRWEEMRKQCLAMLLQVELEQHGIDIGRLAKSSEEDPDTLRSFVSAVVGADASWEADVPRPRVIESTLEDIIWNAVLAGDRNRLEAVPERLAFTTALVDKLIKKGHLSGSAREYAVPILAAGSSAVWSARNERWSSRHSATAQMRLIERLVGDVRTWWSPPDNELQRIVSAVPSAIDSVLSKVEAAGYSGGYEILVTEIAAVRTLAESTIQSASTKYPKSKDACVAFVAGCFMIKNNYEAAFQDSYTPERLSAIFDELSADLREQVARSCAAFESDTGDELIKWRGEGTEGAESSANAKRG